MPTVGSNAPALQTGGPTEWWTYQRRIDEGYVQCAIGVNDLALYCPAPPADKSAILQLGKNTGSH